MIFYELTKLYEELVKQGKIGAPGWMNEKVSYGILLGRDGSVRQLLSLKDEKGKAGGRAEPYLGSERWNPQS